ncbi:MAG TPA: MqnA/MqnD/SBP family protein [Candidatus Binatia bacterium]|jgi:ABC-type nitrate/sulfonate/bicarbonate transport system substrate-binding protein
MHVTLAHYRNRFCMFRTYYAIAAGIVKADGLDVSVVEVPDPPSRAQEEALIEGDVELANLYLPNFLRVKLAGAPIAGISTEWKSTAKGNGMFVRADGPVKRPEDLTGRRVASHHKTPHAVHRYLLKHRYGVDEATLEWQSFPQEELLGALKNGEADAVVLIDQFFFRGERDREVRCLYTDGEAWQALTGFPEMIKHMVAVREPLLREHPELREKLLSAFKASFAYSERHLAEIADKFLARYGGDREAILASARYPKIEFTFTETELKIAEDEMKMLVEMGELAREIPIAPLFVI